MFIITDKPSPNKAFTQPSQHREETRILLACGPIDGQVRKTKVMIDETSLIKDPHLKQTLLVSPKLTL